MNTLERALTHIAQGRTYSWDLTALIGLGIPVNPTLRQRLLASATTAADAERIRRQAARMHLLSH